MKKLSLFRMSRLVPIALSVALLASLVQVAPAHAAGILVNTNADNYANDGRCTLREAIDAANLNVRSGTAAGECTAGSATGVDTISFHPAFAPYVITVGSGGAALKQLPFVISPIVIAGLGAAETVLQAAAVPNTATWRIFQVTTAGNLTLDGVTVRNGRCNGSCTDVNGTLSNAGGGIYNTGTLTVINSLIADNVGGFPFGGGGIFSTGTLTVINSTFTGNIAIHSGGGILNSNGNATIINSTFSGNVADSEDCGCYTGGGINNDGVMTVVNSTFTGNIASAGGAIADWETLSVTNSTIVGNSADPPDWGGGIDSASNTTTLSNTILANNSGGNCHGTITDAGYNLDSGNSCNFSSTGSWIHTNPGLGPLASNGGPTQTMKLLAGSPAIDAGNASICATAPVNGRDQRGVLRPLGWGCDIGAFETSHGRGPDTAGVFRPSNGFLFLKHFNLTGFADLALNYGLGGDYPVVGDWDGDGDDTIGVYRGGTFFLRNTNTLGFADIIVSFGQPGDQPVAGDWNGNGVDTIGLYRPSTGQFFLRNTNTTGTPDLTFFLGNPGDVAIAGDWNGDGIDTTGVFRPSNGFIFLKNTNNTGFADIALNYGLGGDKPVTGDWNFDGIDTIGVLRGNIFLLRNQNTNGFADMSFALGNPGDMPIAGNWDGQP